MARPSEYNLNTTSQICKQIALGDSLRDVCEKDDMPSMVTVYKWIAQHDEFANQYARATQERADTMADEMLTVARYEPDVNRARLIVDTFKWHMAKMRPKKYGDKLDIEATGDINIEVVHFAGDTQNSLPINKGAKELPAKSGDKTQYIEIVHDDKQKDCG